MTLALGTRLGSYEFTSLVCSPEKYILLSVLLGPRISSGRFGDHYRLTGGGCSLDQVFARMLNIVLVFRSYLVAQMNRNRLDGLPPFFGNTFDTHARCNDTADDSSNGVGVAAGC